MKKILIVDDDPTFNSMLRAFLEKKEYAAVSVHSAKSALTILREQTFDLILTDFRLPDLDGLTFVQQLKQKGIATPFILITNYSDIRTAIRSIRLGAFEFVTKPVNPDELLGVVEKAIESGVSSGQEERIEDSIDRSFVVGKDKGAVALWEHLEMVAPTKMNVLITGESGTGKEMVARMIHKKSRRADKPFVAVDCGTLSEELASSELFGHVKGSFTGAATDKKGLFEAAHGGTIFLDEVGNLPYSAQIKLLRAIEERTIRPVGSEREIKVDVRILAATNEPLAEAIGKGVFRHDLFHRLNEFELKVPALRERMGDFDTFVASFIKDASVELEKSVEGISSDALNVLKSYAWPGNLRELKNIIKRSVLLCKGSTIEVGNLPEGLNEPVMSNEPTPAIGDETNLKEIHERQERALIEKVLRENKYNKTKAAKLLNIDRTTLYNKIKHYGIDA